MGRKITAALLVTSFLFASAVVYAGSQRKEEVLKRIQMLRIWRLTEVLQLSSDEAAKLFPVLNKYDEQFRAKADAKQKLLHKMHHEMKKETPDDKQLKSLIKKVMVIENEAIQVRHEMYKELETHLTPERLAKFMIFEISFQKEIDQLVTGVRRGQSRVTGIKVQKQTETKKNE